jgi:hypothetical protein
MDFIKQLSMVLQMSLIISLSVNSHNLTDTLAVTEPILLLLIILSLNCLHFLTVLKNFIDFSLADLMVQHQNHGKE